MSELHLRQQSRWTNALYGIMAWMHTSPTQAHHTQARTHHARTHHARTLICMAIFHSFSFPSSLPAPPELNSRRRTIEKSCGAGTHSISSKWNKSHFSLSSLLLLFSFSFSPRPTSVLMSLSLFSVLNFFLSFISPTFISYSLFLLTLSSSFLLSPRSVDQVIPSVSPLWPNKMTHCFLITSALSYSSSIILLVSTT